VNLLKKHLSVANVLSCMALFMALGGVAYAAGTISKKSVKTQHLANGSVTTPKLRNWAVTTAKLRNLAVSTPKLATAAITAEKLGSGAVRSSALGGGVVTTGKLKNGAVATDKLANGAVTNSKLGADALTSGKIQDGAVTGAKLAPSLLAQLVKNVTYASKASDSDSISPKTVTAECPAGKVAIAGGAKLTLGTAIGVALGESAPTAPNAEGKRTGWTATAHEVVGAETESWSVEAHVVCAEL
jgi:trimeric autotransporter adhesin